MMSYEYRKDHRTDKEFQDDIKHYHDCENKWGFIYLIHLRAYGHQVIMKNYGVDSTGTVIKKTLKNCNADKKYIFDNGDEWLVEIKTAPEKCETQYDFFTFKTQSLQTTYNQGAIIIVPMRDHFYGFKNRALDFLLANFQHTKYRGFGNKDCVRIGIKNRNTKFMLPNIDPLSIMDLVDQNMVSKIPWEPRALKLIKKHSAILFME